MHSQHACGCRRVPSHACTRHTMVSAGGTSRAKTRAGGQRQDEGQGVESNESAGEAKGQPQSSWHPAQEGPGPFTPGRTVSACMKSSGRSFTCASWGPHADVTPPASGSAAAPARTHRRVRLRQAAATRAQAEAHARTLRHLEVGEHFAHGDRRPGRAHRHGHVDLLLVPEEHLQPTAAPARTHARTHARTERRAGDAHRHGRRSGVRVHRAARGAARFLSCASGEGN